MRASRRATPTGSVVSRHREPQRARAPPERAGEAVPGRARSRPCRARRRLGEALARDLLAHASSVATAPRASGRARRASLKPPPTVPATFASHVHSAGSRSNSRSANFASSSAASRALTAGSSVPSEKAAGVWEPGQHESGAPRLDPVHGKSRRNDSANERTPSRSSFWHASSSGMPTLASFDSVASRPRPSRARQLPSVPVVLGERLERVRRHRVDRVGGDQLVDVPGVASRRCSSCRCSPTGPLHARALRGQRLPARSWEPR